jgi:asparagine synthase (glutamine-hydrolysing)
MHGVPGPARRALGAALHALARVTPQGTPTGWNSRVPPLFRLQDPTEKFRKLGDILASERTEAVYGHMISLFKRPGDWVPGAREPVTLLRDPAAWPALRDFRSLMMCLDESVYLPDDILVKVDRASMAASLESRAPFLDHTLVEFAWTLPPKRLIGAEGGKLPLRRVLHRHVPRALVERPKMGFGVPLDAWLRGPLRDWAEALLDERRVAREGYLDARRVAAGWRRFLDGTWHGENYLWNLLMFQAWRERWSA